MDSSPFVEVRVVQHYGAAAERVFDAWVNPALAGRWLFATASRPVPLVTIDAHAGGAFRFENRHRGEDVVQTGCYLELVRPRRLIFTLAARSRSSELARVRVDISPDAAGCRLELAHEGVLRDEAPRVEGRWAGMLYGLSTILE
jgi:uncharacterized protein YndB with AHSA1/START domain